MFLQGNIPPATLVKHAIKMRVDYCNLCFCLLQTSLTRNCEARKLLVQLRVSYVLDHFIVQNIFFNNINL